MRKDCPSTSFWDPKRLDDSSQHHLRKSSLKVKPPKNVPKFGLTIGSKEHILTPKIAILGVTHKLPNPYSYPILSKIGCKGGKKCPSTPLWDPKSICDHSHHYLRESSLEPKPPPKVPKRGFGTFSRYNRARPSNFLTCRFFVFCSLNTPPHLKLRFFGFLCSSPY